MYLFFENKEKYDINHESYYFEFIDNIYRTAKFNLTLNGTRTGLNGRAMGQIPVGPSLCERFLKIIYALLPCSLLKTYKYIQDLTDM